MIIPSNDKVDAARWRALLASPLIHVLTDAPHSYTNVAKGAKYLMVEFATGLADPARTHLPTRHQLIEYVDHMLKENKQ